MKDFNQLVFYIVSLIYFVLSPYAASSQDLDRNLLIHYKFDGNFLDSSPNNHDASSIKAEFGTDRKQNPNQCLFLDYSNFVQLPNTEDLKPDFPFSIAAWVNIPDFTKKNVIVDLSRSPKSYKGAWVLINRANEVCVSYGDGIGKPNIGSRQSAVSKTKLQPNLWYHIVGVFRSPINVQLYIDGCIQEVTQEGSGKFDIQYSENAGEIGRCDDSNNDIDPALGFGGRLDDFYLWDRAITQKEIKILVGDQMGNCEGKSKVRSGTKVDQKAKK